MIEAYWSLFVWMLCALLLFALLWKEITRYNKKLLIWRIVATVLLVGSMGFMAVPVFYSSASTTNSNNVVLLTKNYNSDSVKAAFTEATKVFTYRLGEAPAGTLHAQQLNHLSQLPSASANVGVVHVFGDGLCADELQNLNGLPITFTPSDVVTGVDAISWQRNLHAGEQMVVQGTFSNTGNNNVKLLLNGFGAHLDSAILKANTMQQFSLTATPKIEGSAVYNLVAISKGDTVANEPLPVTVQPAKVSKVLVLASSPDFENKFLKSWLAENGYKVAERTAISKNKFSTGFLNTSQVSLRTINSSLLNDFDAVVADSRELASLQRSEAAAIENAVFQKGMGLLIRADSSIGINSFYSRYFHVQPSPQLGAQQLKLFVTDTATNLPVLNVDQQVWLDSRYGTRKLVSDSRNRPMAALALYGAGRVAVSTISHTYEWMLSANNKAYQHLWSLMLTAVLKPQQQQEQWKLDGGLPRQNEPSYISVTYQGTNPTAVVDGQLVYLQQSAFLPQQWTGTWWPADSGWHSYIKSDGTSGKWYVYSSTDYSNISKAAKVQATKAYAATHPAAASAQQTETPIRRRVPLWPFFMVIILSASFLWVENKFL